MPDIKGAVRAIRESWDTVRCCLKEAHLPKIWELFLISSAITKRSFLMSCEILSPYARMLKIPNTGSHTIVGLMKILHTLIGMGSTALVVRRSKFPARDK